MVGDRHCPPLRQDGRDQHELELGERAVTLGPAAQRVGRETVAVHRVDRALIRHDRTRAGAVAIGRYQHRGHRGLRDVVAISGPVKQLSGVQPLRDQAQKGQLDVA